MGKTAGIYTSANLLNSAVPFFLLPILTRYLSPADYGVVAMINVLIAFASPFTGLTGHGALARRYFDGDRDNIPRFVTTILVILVVSTVTLSLIVWIGTGPIARIAEVPRSWLWSVPLISALRSFTAVVLVMWQVRTMAVRYGVYQILLTTLNLGMSILLIVGLGMDWQGRIVGEILALTVFTVAGMIILFRGGWLSQGYDRGDARYALSFGVPLIPHTLGVIVITLSDRLFITRMVGIADTGVYSVGYQVGMIIALLQNSFARAWGPWLYNRLNGATAAVKREIVWATYAYFAAIFAAAVGLSIAAPWFLRFFLGASFAGSAKYVVWVALGYAFSGMGKMVATYIFYTKRTGVVSMVTFLTALLNLGLNYVFISRNGAIGAAQATTLSFLFTFVVSWIVSARLYPMPWNPFRRTGLRDENE